MKTFVSKLTGRRKLELFIWASIFIVSFFLGFVDAWDNVAKHYAPNKQAFANNGMPFLYYRHYFFPLMARYLILFGGFFFLNFFVWQKLFDEDKNEKPGWWLTGSFVLITVLLTLTYIASNAYLFTSGIAKSEAIQQVLKNAVLTALGLFAFTGIYNLLKSATGYVITNAPQLEAKYTFINREGLLALFAWFVSLLLLIISRAERGGIIAWVIVGPTAVLFYWFALFRLIPSVQQKKRAFLRYLMKSFLLLVFVVLVGSLVLLLIIRDENASFSFGFFNGAFQFFITAPVSWIVFRQKQKGKKELSHLKTALGQSHAHFDFLRSQINPHFLFNALNTIYGTALQEGAERTAEGVERLSSMMRFMLQENVQEKIALAREIEYLHNYISLQQLRTGTQTNITIEAQIDATGAEGFQIAPMLLIPFVENAFKHGISFRSPSFIRVSLEIKDRQLLFDVSNSKHPGLQSDPEKGNHGIGLKNVQQRLQLLYPGKHELTIRETAKQFFVHLTVQLHGA